MNDTPKIRRALLSVSDKTGLLPLARALADAGVEILSTGGTARALEAEGLSVTQVADCTGFPEIMDGRIKTLHPRIHGGILARRDRDAEVMRAHGIEAIDLVVVNLYPFARTVANPDCTLAEGIEQIDIGGPAMLRAAAKNHAYVTVVCDPDDYGRIMAGLPSPPKSDFRVRLAAKAFEHTARYDTHIHQWLGRRTTDEALPPRINLSLELGRRLRYGENPHQAAAVYHELSPPAGSLAAAKLVQGKPLSYNNLVDADAAWQLLRGLGAAPACVIVKHTNPCGVALGEDCVQAYRRAFACDPTSAFGGVIALNRPLDASTAGAILDNQFLEVLIVPSVDADTLEVLAAKPRIRVLAAGDSLPAVRRELQFRRFDGGWLVQQDDTVAADADGFRVVTRARPDDAAWRDLLFAWQVVRHVRSNAIVYAAGSATLGIGAGQMSRVDSARIGVWKAGDVGLSLAGAVMASDAFFPFADSIETAAAQGIRAVIQPGGSMRDEEVIAACDAHDMAMVMTGRRHFSH